MSAELDLHIEDGSYWINDIFRYGWEVVRVIDNTVYRFGIHGGADVSDTSLRGMQFTKIESPP